jgi:hypothetical protein
VQIGTLNEGALHAQLKEWYRRPGDLLEQAAGGFVVDLVRGDLLVEIQTGGFAPLRRKLELLAHEHPVRLVAPVPLGRRLVSVEERRLLATPADAAGLLPLALPELFDTAELAQAAGIERRLAQQMTYCLRAMGVLETAGKRSGAVVHRRAA